VLNNYQEEQSINRVAKKIAGRPVAVLGHGPSLAKLEPYRFPLNKRASVCWATINRPGVVSPLLKPMHQAVDLLWLAAPSALKAEEKALLAYLARPDGPLWLTRPRALREFPGDVVLPRPRIVPFACEGDQDATHPADTIQLFPPMTWEVPSIASLVLALLKAGAPKVYVFGADGKKSMDNELYYHGSKPLQAQSFQTIPQDTANLNTGWAELLKKEVWHPGQGPGVQRLPGHGPDLLARGPCRLGRRADPVGVRGMSLTSKFRGHEIEDTGCGWVFCVSGRFVKETWKGAGCGHCGVKDTAEGHDGCLGILPGVMNACCGHGQLAEVYVQFWDSTVIEGNSARIIMAELKRI